MAPSRADARLDIDALGAVAHYLLTGQPVFEAESDLDLLHKVINEQR